MDTPRSGHHRCTSITHQGGDDARSGQLKDIIGGDAYSQDGDKLGQVGQVFLDDSTGEAEFASVRTGLFGMKESLVPITDASLEGDRLTVPFSKETIKDAPNVEVEDGHLDEAQERELYDYYGMAYPGGRDAGAPAGDRDAAGRESDPDAVGHDLSGPTTDEAMTRSEENLRVGTTSEETGRARLRKYVVTEEETHTVPVRKERAVVESEPITAENRDEALAGPGISEEEHEVTLREERPVVEKTTEPVERVRLAKEEDTGEERVTEEVRQERIRAEGDVDDSR